VEGIVTATLGISLVMIYTASFTCCSWALLMYYLVHIQISMGGGWNPECQELNLDLHTLNILCVTFLTLGASLIRPHPFMTTYISTRPAFLPAKLTI